MLCIQCRYNKKKESLQHILNKVRFFFIIPGETKPGHPVTRTGSDRRPDAVREESSKGSQDSQDNVHDKHEDDTSHTER